jgi:tRNA A-37 threonylcarbamoyl transferase component Bud32
MLISMPDLMLLAQGREAEVFLRSDGSVLKLLRESTYGPRAEREAAALRSLNADGYSAPKLLELVTVNGRRGIVTERIDGENLLVLLGRNPLSIFWAGRTIGRAHAEMHQVRAPHDLPDLNDDLRRRIDIAPHLPDHLRDFALSVLVDLPHGDRLCHGDFHLGNLLGSWSTPFVIDWGDASRGDPTADVARTGLLQRLGDLPPGAPAHVRFLAPVGRKLLADRYLATYRRRHPVDPEDLERWKVVWAAARLLEPIPAEHPKLIRFLEQRLSTKPR